MRRNEGRTVGLYTTVTPEEKSVIDEKMARAGIDNLRAYLRKMALDGYVVRVDMDGVLEVVKLLRSVSNNVNQIDSIGLLPLLNEEGLPCVDEKAAVNICPYFQALNDESIVYNVELYLNGRRFRNRPSKLFDLFPMQGYAGYYFNGEEMLHNNLPIPVGIMNKSYLHEGDVIKVKLISITKDYMYFLVSQKLAVGINPIMGAFPATATNIFSNCNAIGWFSTTSSVEAECVYHEW